MQTVTTSTVASTFATVKPTDVAASRLMDADVHTKQHQDIGEIEDLVVENGDRVSAVILSVGGFLGVGERYVAVDPSSITLMRSADGGTFRAVVDAPKDQLNNAPTFDHSRFRR